MLRHLRPALVLLTGLASPLAVTGIAGALFPVQARGSLVRADGTLVGSAIGQAFAGPRAFHGRPPATVAPDPAAFSAAFTLALPVPRAALEDAA